MSSNLPPGCNSNDGGIDHALEAALEMLCDRFDSPDLALALIELIPAVKIIRQYAFNAGIDEQKLLEVMERHDP